MEMFERFELIKVSTVKPLYAEVVTVCGKFGDLRRVIKAYTVKIPLILIYSFRLMDISVHLQECSPFLVGNFITINKENYHVYCFMKTCAF